MGKCRGKAAYSVVPDGAEMGDFLNLCDKCMREFYSQAKTVFKRVPTVKGEKK